jgi:hypothetical protein
MANHAAVKMTPKRKVTANAFNQRQMLPLVSQKSDDRPPKRPCQTS